MLKSRNLIHLFLSIQMLLWIVAYEHYEMGGVLLIVYIIGVLKEKKLLISASLFRRFFDVSIIFMIIAGLWFWLIRQKTNINFWSEWGGLLPFYFILKIWAEVWFEAEAPKEKKVVDRPYLRKFPLNVFYGIWKVLFSAIGKNNQNPLANAQLTIKQEEELPWTTYVKVSFPVLYFFLLLGLTIGEANIWLFVSSIANVMSMMILLHPLGLKNLMRAKSIVVIILLLLQSFALTALIAYSLKDVSFFPRLWHFQGKNQSGFSSPYSSESSIGSNEESVDFEGKVLFRYEPSEKKENGFYLVDGKFNTTVSGTVWSVGLGVNKENEKEKGFVSQTLIGSDGFYQVPKADEKRLVSEKVIVELPKGKSVGLVRPYNLNSFTAKGIGSFEWNNLGTLSALTHEGQLELNFFVGEKEWAGGPVKSDEYVPRHLHEVLDQFIQEHDLWLYSQEELPEKIKSIFKENYKYTLNLSFNGRARSLNDFLLGADPRGHCEFYATSSVLLLRKMGIPARYVTGFYVSNKNWNQDEELYWVRDYNGHAWAEYWDGSSWNVLESTPPSFEGLGQSYDGVWQKIEDYLFYWQYKASNLEPDQVIALMQGKQLYWGGLGILFLLILKVKWRKESRNKSMLVNALYWIDSRNERKKESVFEQKLNFILRKNKIEDVKLKSFVSAPYTLEKPIWRLRDAVFLVKLWYDKKRV